jgi:hypothetical protein
LHIFGTLGRQGQLTKAKLLWNSLPDQFHSDPRFMEIMLYCMERYLNKLNPKLKDRKNKAPEVVNEHGVFVDELPSIGTFTPTSAQFGQDNVKAILWADFGQSRIPQEAVGREAVRFWTQYVLHQNRLTTELLDRYMELLLCTGIDEYQFLGTQIYDEYERLGLKKGSRTYFIALDLFRQRCPFLARGVDALWKEYLEWDRVQEQELCDTRERKLTSKEKDRIRQQQGRSHFTMFANFIRVVHAYTM